MLTKKRIMLPEYTGDGRKDFDALKRAVSDYLQSLEGKGSLSIETEIVTAQGLQFPATQVASTDANTLDDYEEGAWTPAVTFATPGDLSVTYSTRTGYYTKIGRLVIGGFAIVTSAFTWTTAAGALRVTGLPFQSNASYTFTGKLEWSGITSGLGYTELHARIDGNANLVRILASGMSVAEGAMTTANAATGSSIILIGNIQYVV